MNKPFYIYKQEKIAFEMIGIFGIPVIFFKDMSKWWNILIFVICVTMVLAFLINLAFVFISNREIKKDEYKTIKVKNVKYKPIYTLASARHEKEVKGYKIFYNGKSYIYITKKNENLEKHFSKVYQIEYYKTYRIVKNIKYNN